MPPSPASRLAAMLISGTLAIGLPSCTSPPAIPVTTSPQQPALGKTSYASFDGDRFPYKKWMPKSEPRTVVIGFHGIAGASDDLRNLGEHLQAHLPGTAVYAPDTRGQGSDPQVSRRGDIRHAEDWYRDAHTFTRLVRTRHPKARIVWFGESMGSLIALHAAARADDRPPPCDALIISSPITAIRGDVSRWRVCALNVGATLFPKARISLEGLSGQQEAHVTSEVVHQEQAATNAWHVDRFTLRLLKTLERLIRTLPAQAPAITEPVLVLYGGQDVFSVPADVERFTGQFPPAARVVSHYYPDSYHLLFYDRERERVLADVTRWLDSLDE